MTPRQTSIARDGYPTSPPPSYNTATRPPPPSYNTATTRPRTAPARSQPRPRTAAPCTISRQPATAGRNHDPPRASTSRPTTSTRPPHGQGGGRDRRIVRYIPQQTQTISIMAVGPVLLHIHQSQGSYAAYDDDDYTYSSSDFSDSSDGYSSADERRHRAARGHTYTARPCTVATPHSRGHGSDRKQSKGSVIGRMVEGAVRGIEKLSGVIERAAWERSVKAMERGRLGQ